jgi:hypothetical protein
MQISTVDTSTLNFGCDFGLKKQLHGPDSPSKKMKNLIALDKSSR